MLGIIFVSIDAGRTKTFFLNDRISYTLSRSFLAVLLLISAGSALYSQTPVAAFTANKFSGCAPLNVSFTDQSSGTPVAWNWDLGNGQLSTAQNPIITYTAPGVYTVRLVVRSANGIDEEIKTDYITVSAAPQAGFRANITTACVPATIQFTDQSFAPANAGTIVSWAWDFGDGTTSTQQSPSHVYSATGFYSVTLTVVSNTGCSSTASAGRYIRVVDGVEVNFDFSPSTTCRPPFAISFTD